MIRRHITALRASLMAADGLSAIALFVIVSLVRFRSDWIVTWQAVGADPLWLAAAYGATWVLILWITGLYRLRTRWTWRSEVLDLSRATLLVAVTTFCALFVFKLPNVSRLFLLELFIFQGVVTVASRSALRWTFRNARRRGLNTRFMLVVGDGPGARSFAARVDRHPELGLRIIGFLAVPPSASRDRTDATRADDAEPNGIAVIGYVDDIVDILHSHVVDEVAICLPRTAWAFAEPITSLCAEEGRIVRIPVDGGSPVVYTGRVEDFDGMQVLSLVHGPDRAAALFLKRVVDIGGAVIALILLSPVFLIVAGRVMAVDGRPVFFRQTRIGLHGRPFMVIKFRTMRPDAEELLPELAAQNEISGHAFKLTEDPRLTRSGRFLRRSSLDELPQLWNVLRGEMSLVGPRPPLPSEVDNYDLWHRRRLSMKPGMTGLWQVAARREQEFDRWVALDLDYIDRWSLWLDVKILARTIPAVLNGAGR